MGETDTGVIHLNNEKDEGPAPEYRISKDLSDLTLMFIVSSVVYFLAAGSLAILMRLLQSGVPILQNQQSVGLFYTALTVHGQVMFFGFVSMLTVGISVLSSKQICKEATIQHDVSNDLLFFIECRNNISLRIRDDALWRRMVKSYAINFSSR